MSTGSASRATTKGTGPVSPGCQPSSRASPSASDVLSAAGSTGGSTHATGEEAGIDRQPGRELEAARACGRGEPVAVGPGRLGVDVVDRDRRDAAPVVDAGVEQARKVVVGEVRRRLHRDVGRQQQPRRRDRPEMVVEARLGMRRHAGTRLGAEVLHDHLLQVAVPLVQLAQGLERLDPLRPRLADPDQDPARERDPQLAGQVDRLQAAGGLLVRRGPVRAALRGEPLGDRLEHDPHRGRDRPQRDQLVAAHHARIQVRQQAGLLEDELRDAAEVLDRRLAAERRELGPRDLVAQLRLVAEREERLRAAGRRAGARDREHLGLGQVRPLAAPWRARERAVAADVAAERRQRDEDLRRVGDEPASPRRRSRAAASRSSSGASSSVVHTRDLS